MEKVAGRPTFLNGPIVCPTQKVTKTFEKQALGFEALTLNLHVIGDS